jgi:hypothetical protein
MERNVKMSEKGISGNDTFFERSEEPSSEALGKKPYETPLLIAFGAVRDVTQTPPPIVDCSGIACNE